MSVIPFLRFPSRSEGFRLSEGSELKMTCETPRKVCSLCFSPSSRIQCSSTLIFMIHICSSGHFHVLRSMTLRPAWFKCTIVFFYSIHHSAKHLSVLFVSPIFLLFCFHHEVLYLHSLRMRSSGLLLIFLGKSIFSMPFKMNVYVIIWSLPEKGGLWSNNSGKSSSGGCCSVLNQVVFHWIIRGCEVQSRCCWIRASNTPTCQWAAQKPGSPKTRSPHWSCGPCSGWSQGPHTLESHRKSRFSGHIASFWQSRSQPGKPKMIHSFRE